MTDIAITRVVNVSLSAANPGANAYNTSNLAIVTGEPVLGATQTISFSAVAANGALVLRFGSTSTSSIAYNATADTIQGYINDITGLENVIVTGSIASKTLTLTQPGIFGAIAVPTVPTNTLEDAGTNPITVTPATVSSGWSGGSLGYALYDSPQSVATDFGTSSVTFLQADAVFSQQPNILAGDGQLIALLRNVSQQTITLSADPTGGAFTLSYNAHTTSSLAHDATTAQIQAALRAVEGLESVIVTGSLATAFLTVFFNGVYGPALALSASANTLVVGTVPVTLTFAETVAGETYGETIARTKNLVSYFGVMPNETVDVMGQTDTLAAAAIILPLNLIGFNVSYVSSTMQPGGILALLQSGTFTNSRGLYYGDTAFLYGANSPAVMMASYAGRALSVDFSGSNTTITMNLKQLRGVQPDPTMNDTIYDLAIASGADIYVSYQGVPSIVSNGANQFFDRVYNAQWFIGALQIAGFNYLAQTGTKVPQTENGMDGLKAAYRGICKQGVTNQYSAPGSWTSSTTFGNQVLFLQNIQQFGFYVYSQPISQQLAVDRAARKAPLCQIAVKEAGAIQSSNVLVFVNP